MRDGYIIFGFDIFFKSVNSPSAESFLEHT